MKEGKEEESNLNLLFETSWEVCNKIGGIYTVLSTKAKTLQKLYKDKVVFVGPDVWSDDNPSPFFIENRSVLKDWRKSLQLPFDIKVRVGRWDIPGKPIAVLVDFKGVYQYLNEVYGEMWSRYGVDSLHAYGDYDEGCAFAIASAIVMQSIYRHHGSPVDVIAHFNEWTTGMGLLYLKWQEPAIATVFTTHATSIGRSICGNGKPLYNYLKGYNGDQMARELNMESKHSLEKAAAHAADCFTTVSDITAVECEQLLDLKPAVVTPNGFEKNFVPARTQFAKARKDAREKLLSVARALTGKQLDDDTFIVVTSGRCEYRNKGIDVFLDSMNALRGRTQSRVLALVMVPAWVDKARGDLQDAMARGCQSGICDPVITHTLHNYNEDPIINRIHQLGFGVDVNDSVTVVYVPCYLNGDDGIFNSPYYGLLIGVDATVFPSYYEPWGYTPLESVAFGVPTVTTSLSGFGQWILSSSEPDFDISGVNVIPRTDSNYHEVADAIAQSLMKLICAPAVERAKIAKAAMDTASEAAWSHFIKWYENAFDIALHNAEKRQ
ncbi:glycosyltransferase [Muribaculaceae bacterium Isolate-002 (NCI)]|nr:glycosyltransferase [Muribaculaceae bacterium Isolate-002 (NCI)]